MGWALEAWKVQCMTTSGREECVKRIKWLLGEQGCLTPAQVIWSTSKLVLITKSPSNNELSCLWCYDTVTCNNTQVYQVEIYSPSLIHWWHRKMAIPWEKGMTNLRWLRIIFYHLVIHQHKMREMKAKSRIIFKWGHKFWKLVLLKCY